MSFKRIFQLITTKFIEFSKHCTLHGFHYFSTRAHSFVYILWCCVIAAGFVLCAVLSNMIWAKFAEDPTFTVVESAHYPTEDIPFSAVAVCDAQVYGPATRNITNILTLRGFNATQIQDFYKSFQRVKHKNYKPMPHVIRMHVVLEELKLSYYDLLHQLKKPCEELLKECSWRSEVLDCSVMFREVFTVYGYCCQFDINYFKRSADNDTNFTAGVLKSEALHVAVHNRRVHPDGSEAAGRAVLYVFDQENRLTLLDSSIILTPATHYDVTVDLWLIDASSDVKNLALSSRKCFLDSNGIHSTSYQSCITSFMMKEIIASCLCLPFDYTPEDLEEQHPRCRWERLACVHRALDKVQGEIRNILSERECYQKCDYVQYETRSEYETPQRSRGVNKDNSGLTYVTVHYANNICIKYRREVLYTWDQMLANLGGIFGLCLGGSIISIIELVWFTLDLLGAVVCRLRKNLKEQRKIFIVQESRTESYRKKRNEISKYPFVN